ncbi:RES family NAD+ phosphorylase [Pedobacter gandavensis]|uniref:RES domain-containing protein n=1 Tax=Pedobacter gandavensis TaxID=2679963 RepID=A0ABR6ETG9_9SPHI|nr:RES family NAD+ phosphorylase [Pedobacter gandavensis]MBB2148347.1 RES domain-containing protein [Pedobacter gandavensis]
MNVFRISLSNYAGSLVASGRAARWNPNETSVIYSAESRSLACLENVVHRSQFGLNNAFQVMTIEIPDDLPITTILLKTLPKDWFSFENMSITQEMGDNWIKKEQTAIMKVPSSIISAEANYLINPNHPDFKFIKLLKCEPFIFDKRIKM